MFVCVCVCAVLDGDTSESKTALIQTVEPAKSGQPALSNESKAPSNVLLLLSWLLLTPTRHPLVTSFHQLLAGPQQPAGRLWLSSESKLPRDRMFGFLNVVCFVLLLLLRLF